MTSVAVYARDWGQAINLGLDPAAFQHILLCEGDSWMDRSSPTQLSLPWALEESFTASGSSVLLVNLSRFGDTMVRIGQHVNKEFLQWVKTQWNYRGILVSAGGNDFIDAAADVDPGQGILNVFQPGMGAAGCVNAAAVAKLRHYMDQHFDTLLAAVQQHQPATTLYLNSYCTPTARDAPAYPTGQPWLHRAYTKHGIPPNLWPAVTDEVFTLVDKAVQDWSQKAANIVKVPTASANLIPAAPNSSGSDGDWQNEIHPNKSGWRKLAAVWRQSMNL